jgi:hypothetical protein
VTGPYRPADPIILDSPVLVAYERMRTPDAAALHEAQARVAQWLLREVPLLIPALSLTVASLECGGDLPEIEFLLGGDPQLVLPVTLAADSAVDVGRTSAGPRAEDLEVAQVVWCAAGHDPEDQESWWPVATFWPDWYAKAGIPTIAL